MTTRSSPWKDKTLRLAMIPWLLVVAGPIALAGAPPIACEKMKSVALPHTTIMAAQLVGAGELQIPNLRLASNLPAFCRITAVARPSSDSEIKMEVWLPAAQWNGRFRGTGNGGFAGSISYTAMAYDLANGYATAGTDTGHQGSATDGSWALHHPDKIEDFGYRGIHEMTVAAKALVQAFYGDAPKHSYFLGCSDGGREALMEAQRFPGDYDGILAGAPANYWSHLLLGGMNDVRAMQTEGAYIPPAKIPAISSAVLAACDALDGLKDGILNDPRKCHFNPEVLLCKGEDGDNCLTKPQVATLRQIYAGPHSSDGKPLFPGYVPGGEEGRGGWESWVTGDAPNHSALFGYGSNYFQYMVFDEAGWQPSAFNIDSAVKVADEKTGRMLNAIDPDLRPFAKHGGKLILYHGWSDPAIPPLNTIDYFNSVVGAMGETETQKSLRLYMAPGLQHCTGGPGPNSFGQFGPAARKDKEHDVTMALEQWVENQQAPEQIIATNGKMARPLCPYPQVATYKGSGDSTDAASFTCSNK